MAATSKKTATRKAAARAPKKSATKRAAKKAATAAKKSAPKVAASKKRAAPLKKAAPQKPSAGKKAAASKEKKQVPDLSALPPGALTRYSTLVCLACIFDLFTKQFRLAPRTAYSEIKRHSPTVEELTAQARQRPYFESEEKNPHCPYCGSAKRWHARINTFRVEGGKTTDAPRRALLKSLPVSEEQFQIVEAKKISREVFFEWLDALGRRLDFEDDQAWMLEATRAFLERREQQTDWAGVFEGLRAVRRSQRLGEGWERDGARLFLAPPLYNDALLVQYLVSRSHRHGGRTLEGRLTLLEFVRRLRHAGHLDAHGITERDQFDVLERLVEQLTGGDRPVKLLYIIDRRDFLDKVKTVYAHYA